MDILLGEETLPVLDYHSSFLNWSQLLEKSALLGNIISVCKNGKEHGVHSPILNLDRTNKMKNNNNNNN